MRNIKVIGLGAGDMEQLPLGVYRSLINNKNKIYVRTKDHPVLTVLEQEGGNFIYMDYIYEKHDQFEAVYKEIVAVLMKEAEQEDIVYAVPGHPLVAEKTVQLLIERSEEGEVNLEIGGGQSFLDSIFQALKIDPIDGFQLLDGTDLRKDELQFTQHLIIGQVYDAISSSEVKLTLMEKLPYDYPVTIVTAAGSKQEQIKKIELHELDREMELNNLTSLYVPPAQEESVLYKQFSSLRNIIAALRAPDGCPWDREQTHESLRKHLIEEAYELIEAINEDDIDNMIEELGDVLLQVMLHSQIGEDEGYFSIDDVIEGISAKMVRRHPHVFGKAKAETVEDVLDTWQQAKNAEKPEKQASVLDGVLNSSANLTRAYDLQKKAAKAGFDWPDVSGAWEKVKEEISEFREEVENGASPEKMEKEFGDILFSFVNVARYYKIDPELAIFSTNQKFISRFQYIEAKLKDMGKEVQEVPLEILDKYWEEAKQFDKDR